MAGWQIGIQFFWSIKKLYHTDSSLVVFFVRECFSVEPLISDAKVLLRWLRKFFINGHIWAT